MSPQTKSDNKKDINLSSINEPEEIYDLFQMKETIANTTGNKKNIFASENKEQQNKQLSLIASANKNGVFFTGPNAEITWANESMLLMCGYKLEEITGKTPIEICRGNESDKDALHKMQESFFTGKSFNGEITFYHKTGSSFWSRTSIQPIKDNEGNINQFFGIVEDLTEEKAHEHIFRMALAKIGANIWEHNFVTGETKFSDNENTLLGFTAKDFANNEMLWWNNVHPDDLWMLEESDKKYKNCEQTSHSIEYRMIHKSGQVKWVLDKGVVVEFTNDGKPIRIIGSHTDITAVKETEFALRENEQKFRSLAENIPGVLYNYEYRSDGTEAFTYISPDAEKKIGVSTDQLQRYYDILHPNDAEKEIMESKESRKAEGHYHFEGRFLLPGNRQEWLRFSSSTTFIKDDGTIVRTGIITNITKEKNAEHALQIREEKYRSIIANMKLGIIEVDNNECIQFVNNSFCEMSGYAIPELLNKKITQFFTGGFTLKQFGKSTRNNSKAFSDAYEINVKNKIGEDRWWLVSGAPHYNDKGYLVGSIGIYLDITRQKRLESDLRNAKEQALGSSKAKEAFLANMSHEIRTPMNAIMGMCKQMSKTKLEGKQQFYLDTIITAADNLLVIINDILDLSKIEAGKLTIENTGFNINEVITNAIGVFSHKAEEKGLQIVTQQNTKSFAQVLIGDPYRISQVLLNLISNSIKFSDKGNIEIECNLLSDNTSNQKIEILVKDSGIGMDEHFVRNNLFKKFSQEVSSGSRRYNGTGLGLNICKNLVELMGGEIFVISKKNEGTTIGIRMQLPKGTEQDVKPKEAPIVNAEMLEGKTILVTDDNDMNRLVAITILQNYNAETIEASTGQEALDIIATQHIDLVLMDIQMPVMNGLDATRQIRKNLKSKLPVIALTANAVKGEEEKCLSAGMDDFIPKPFNEDHFINTIARWLGSSVKINKRTQKSTDENKLYDLKILNDISRGNKDFVQKMVMLFMKQSPVSVNEIKKAFEENNLEKVRSIAHRMKPTIGNMGISSLAADIRRIEALAEENKHIVELGSLIKRLDEILNAVVEQLKDEFY